MDLIEIINRISFIRTRANLSARELSLRIGKNESYINRLEYRKNFEPSITVINDIVDACGSTLEEFFYENISQYPIDKPLIDLVKTQRPEFKQSIIDMIKNVNK